MIHKKLLFFLLFSFCNCTLIFAQKIEIQTRILPISSQDRMPDDLVNSIVKDNQGFYWFATDNGLCRYDGTHIVTFKNIPTNPQSLPHNRVFDVTTDSQGELWIATSFGLAIYNRESNNFIRINPNNDTHVIPNPYITHVKSQGDFIWFTTPSFLCKINIKTKVITTIAAPRKIKNKEPFIHAMNIDNQGIIWLSVEGFLYNFNPNNNLFTEIEPFSHLLLQSQDNLITSIFSSTNKIWLGTSLGDVYCYNKVEKKIVNIPMKSLVQNLGVNGFFEDNSKRIYVLLDKKGIGFINQNTNSIELVENSYFNLVDNCSIICAYVDSDKNIWFGHKKNGVSYISSSTLFSLINTDFEQGKYLSSNTVSALLYDKSNSLWLGTDGGGLYKKSINTGNYYIPQNQIKTESILSLFQDSKGFIWIGTFRDGVYVLSQNGQIVNHFIKNGENSIASNDVRSIIEDKNGVLWFATHGAGVTSYNPLNKTFKNYNSLTIGISGDWTYDIVCSHDNKIWVATNFGLTCIDGNRKMCKTFYATHSPNSLINNNVYCLLEDNKNRIWCGTQEGLSCYDTKSGRFTNFLATKETIVNILTLDKEQNIWVGTNLGLYKLNSNGDVEQHFNKNSQLVSDCFVRSSKTFDNNGILYFGTTNGLISFQPQKIKSKSHVVSLTFTDIHLNNTSIFEDTNIAFQLNKDSILELPYYKNSISFYFVDLQWQYSYKGELYYQLVGIDTIAKASTADRQVSYSNISPGTYVFKLGYFENGEFKTQVSLYCNILQPWWFRWWAFCLYILVIIILMRLFYVYVKVTTTANNKLMIEQNKSKHMEELYEAKLRFFTNISHDIRNPLTLIANPVNTLLAKKDIDSESRTLLTIMKRNTNQLLQLINELLEFRKIEAGMVKLSLQPCNIVTMAHQIIDDFQNQAFQKNITLTCTSELPCLIANVEPHYFEKAIYNLLSNAFKFTPENGKIAVKLEISDHVISHKNMFRQQQSKRYIAIEISDSGTGIPADKMDKIFERFYEGENPSGTESSGIGLSIVKSIIEQHQGFVTVDNRNGAVFTLFIPMDNSINVSEYVEHSQKTENIDLPEQRVYSKELKSQTVLIVEDNIDLRLYLDMLLSKHYSIMKACNGKEAFELALSISPDLILSDVMMPEMNGIDLCIKIKKSLETSHIPVILLTAKNLDEAQKEGLQAGADDYITKPFVDEVLLLKITNILTTREQLCARFSIENKDITEIASTSADSQFMSKFMKIIEQEYTDSEFSLEKIADLICLSRSQVYKKSIALTGKTPVEIIQEVRMQNALNLLKGTTLSISEIAYSVGYSDPRYFSNRFKKMIGITPTELREKQSE